MKYQVSKMKVAAEAWPFALPVLALTVLALIFGGVVLPAIFYVISVCILLFFRNPIRQTPADADSVICPADGVITAAGIVAHSDFPDGQALRVAVFMSVFNVHINWAPCAGTVEKTHYVKGKFVNAMNDKAAQENEHKDIWVRRGDGRLVIFTPVAGLIARRIVNPVEEGDELAVGEKVGLIRFGSKVEVLMPADAKLLVKVGQKVVGGLTVIARFDDVAGTHEEEKNAVHDTLEILTDESAADAVVYDFIQDTEATIVAGVAEESEEKPQDEPPQQNTDKDNA